MKRNEEMLSTGVTHRVHGLAHLVLSNRVVRAILLDAPPSLDVGEATDKGSINQRMVLRHRAALVQELYSSPSPRVIAIDER